MKWIVRKMMRLIYRIYREWHKPKPMKILILILFPFFSYAQTFTLSDGSKLALVDDKGAILITLDAPKEIQLAPGVKYKFILVEVPDNTEGKTITISEKTQPTPITEKVDAEKATFIGTWFHGPTTAPGWYESTIAFSNSPGAEASYTFTGTGIELWAEKLDSHGTGVVTITQGTALVETKPVSFKGVKTLPAKIYEKKGLPRGTYTIKLTAGAGYSLLDYFTVVK